MTSQNPSLAIGDPVERLIVEHALAFARELKATADGSPDGRVLHNAEGFCFVQGREFLRTALAAVAQAQAASVEKKGPQPASATTEPAATTKGTTTRKS